MLNILTAIDGYKTDHRRQYPDNTQRVYSNFTPRDSRIEEIDEVVFFGLQAAIQKYLVDGFKSFFATEEKDLPAVLQKYSDRMLGYLGPNEIGTDHLRELWQLGYLPLTFKALPEGTAVPLRVPMFTVENTDDRFAWVVNYFETLLSSAVWMPCTSATTARRYRKILEAAAQATGASVEFIDWQAHDFSFRGMAGPEAAAMSGAGHLVFFTGTDTIPALDFIEDYYDPTFGTLIGGSVAATEHSVMCAGGQESEMQTFERLLNLYPSGIVSVVSDTWDLWNVCTKILPALKDRILARDGKLVVRPDSGDPVKIIVGDPDATPGTPEFDGVVVTLAREIGFTTNAAGFKELDPHIGVIYGDSITPERCLAILRGLYAKGFASSNIVFGVGSYTYQHTTRDTFGFAMKATWCQIDGKGYDIFKDPVTDDGVKKSAKGRLAVLRDAHGALFLKDQASLAEERHSLLESVWANGQFTRTQTFENIRQIAKEAL